MGKKSVVVQAPANIHTGFKVACTLNGKTMTAMLVNFMESYARGNNTLIEAEDVDQTDYLAIYNGDFGETVGTE